nr:hypothetical protein Iba_chr15bCG8470 [Ipomoea batatas]
MGNLVILQHPPNFTLISYVQSDCSVGNWAWVESDGSVPLVGRQSRGEVQRTASAVCQTESHGIGKHGRFGFTYRPAFAALRQRPPSSRRLKMGRGRGKGGKIMMYWGCWGSDGRDWYRTNCVGEEGDWPSDFLKKVIFARRRLNETGDKDEEDGHGLEKLLRWVLRNY